MRTQAKPPPGTAEYVIAHAAIRRVAGLGPSLPFMGVTDPVQALATARDFLKEVATPAARRDATLSAVGEIVCKRSRAGLPMDDAEFRAAVSHIVQTSSSRAQIIQRLAAELGYTGNVSMRIFKPKDAISREAAWIIRGLTGGQFMSNGAHNLVRITAPSGQRITV